MSELDLKRLIHAFVPYYSKSQVSDRRINFKTALLVSKSPHGLAPKYISDILEPYEPAWTLRTSGGEVVSCWGPETEINTVRLRFSFILPKSGTVFQKL